MKGKIIIFLIIISLFLVSFTFFLIPRKVEKEGKNYTTTTIQKELKTTTTIAQQTTTTQTIEERVSYKEIFIHADRFEPIEITINKNEKVKWINKDSKQHEIVCTTNGEPLFDIVVNAGESFDFPIFSNTECWDPTVGETKMRMKIIVR